MKDFLLDTDGDLKIENGDLVTGDSDQQHQFDILKSDKGHNKEFPGMGVGMEEYLNDDDISGMLNEIRKQFKADGMKVNSVKLNQNGNLEIDANY